MAGFLLPEFYLEVVVAHEITPEKRRAAVEALGFDPNVVMSVSLATDWATVVVAELVDGVPQVVDGALLTQTLSGPVTDVEVTE